MTDLSLAQSEIERRTGVRADLVTVDAPYPHLYRLNAKFTHDGVLHETSVLGGIDCVENTVAAIERWKNLNEIMI